MNPVEALRRSLRHFGEITRGSSPLYAELSPCIAEDDVILALAENAAEGQPAVNLLYGAVHDLLLRGIPHELAAFYPSVGGTAAAEDAFPAFADFCRVHGPEIVDIVATRRVQTNEVGRCGVLLPAVAFAWERLARPPLHLVEVGASAGLNLLLDRYRYEYAGHAPFGAEDAPCIRTEWRGRRTFPVPERAPDLVSRVGVDIAPVDVRDDAAVRWVEALIWPDQMHRIELFRRAVALARRDPPRIVRGDAMDRLGDLVREADDGVIPCVLHSHAIYQMPEERREEFFALVEELANERPLVLVSLEWLGPAPAPWLHVTLGSGRDRRTTLLGEGHYHGAWLRWTFTETGNRPERRGAMERLGLWEGDLVEADVDAIVNAANEALEEGGGVCGAIHRAAGPELARECATLPRCPVGTACVTGGHDLPAKHVIHAVGPVYRGGTSGEPEQLASAYRESLRLAAEHGFHTVAFPAISTGIFGYPMREAADIALRTIREWLDANELPERVDVVLFTAADLGMWQAAAMDGA